MRKIILIEPFFHQEVLYRWLEVMVDMEGWEVTVFCRSALADQLPESLQNAKNIKWQFFIDLPSFSSFLSVQRALLLSTDAVIWMTLASRYDLLAAVPLKANLLVVVHNVQSVFAPKMYFSIKAFQKFIAYFLRRQFAFRQRLLKRNPFFLFPTQAMQSTALVTAKQSFRSTVWPFSYSQNLANSQNASPAVFSIIVPGTVNPESRDYTFLQRAFSLVPKRLYSTIKLTFLGKCSILSFEKSWQNLAQEKGFQVQFHKEHLSQKAYETAIQEAHLLVLPLKQKVRVGAFEETMGQSKISGGLFDAVHWQKPLILPAFFSQESGQKNLYYYKNEEHLAELLSAFLNQKNSSQNDFSPSKKQLSKNMAQTLRLN